VNWVTAFDEIYPEAPASDAEIAELVASIVQPLSAEEILQINQSQRHMPGALPFVLNGSGTFYLFDLGQAPVDGEYPIVGVAAGNQSWKSCFPIADSLEAACRGTIDIDDMRIADHYA